MVSEVYNHEVISASAGSGKTFQLTNRYLNLVLARNINPEAIIALTFSRKAASEIFDTIIDRLALGTRSSAAARLLGCQIRVPDLNEGDCIRCLRTLLSCLHKNRIGTYDSFFIWILRTFAWEFGVTGNFRIVDPLMAAVKVQDVLNGLFQRGRNLDDAHREFVEIFKRATFGRQEKALSNLLSSFVENYHHIYLDSPNRENWGSVNTIWPDGCESLVVEFDIENEIASLKAQILDDSVSKKEREAWETFLFEVEAFSPYTQIAPGLRYLLEKLVPKLDDLKAGSAELKINRETRVLSSKACQHLYNLVTHIVGICLRTQIQKTCGIREIIQRFETRYNIDARCAGELTFSDVQTLLDPADTGVGNCLPLSQKPGAADRLYIDYRLDSRFEHWLLDEFQDTSTLQWRIIENLIDEVVQDTSGARTFFYVGDLKQAIHGWRGGDWKLFEDVADKYNHDGVEQIKRIPLAESYRSCQPVIDTVNMVFEPESLATIRGPALRRWERNWRRHTTTVHDKSGYATLLRVPRESGARSADHSRARWQILAETIKKLPFERNDLSVAVLVKTNRTGSSLTSFLRVNGVSAIWEGDLRISDNPVVTAFVSLIKISQHPGDSMAEKHLRMTPFSSVMTRCFAGYDQLVVSLNKDIHAGGFSYLIEKWITLLEKEINITRFGRRRIDELLAAARKFDASGSRSSLDFIEYIERYTTTELTDPTSVRVMTMHKSKGLGFDVVLLPDLQDKSVLTSSRPIDLAVRKSKGAESRTEWVLAMPLKTISNADPVLKDYIERHNDDYCYEELCLFYVAMTRAKRGLYMITTASAQRSQAVYPATLLEHALEHRSDAIDAQSDQSEMIRVFETGDPDWHHDLPEIENAERPEPAPAKKMSPESPGRLARNLKRITPSGVEDITINAGKLFSLNSTFSAELGISVHELFQHITWLDDTDTVGLVSMWAQDCTVSDAVKSAVRGEFENAIRSPAFRKLLAKPERDTDLWREQRFEIVLNNEYVSGCFDRVSFARGSGPTGVEQAEIIDYKTDNINPDTDLAAAKKKYRPQLELYRKVIAKITDLPAKKISCKLAFTKTGTVVEI